MIGWRTVTLIGVIATLLGAFAGLVLSRPVAPKQDDLYTRQVLGFRRCLARKAESVGKTGLIAQHD